MKCVELFEDLIARTGPEVLSDTYVSRDSVLSNFEYWPGVNYQRLSLNIKHL